MTLILRPLPVLIGVLVAVLASACTGSDRHGGSPSPADRASSPVGSEPTTPTPAPTPTCGAFPSGPVSQVGSGFVVELDIMSGMPNPAWRLSRAEGRELRSLLASTPRGIDRDGPEELGGYGVRADRRADARFLRGHDLPRRFWVQGDTGIARVLERTLPCEAAKP